MKNDIYLPNKYNDNKLNKRNFINKLCTKHFNINVSICNDNEIQKIKI